MRFISLFLLLFLGMFQTSGTNLPYDTTTTETEKPFNTSHTIDVAENDQCSVISLLEEFNEEEEVENKEYHSASFLEKYYSTLHTDVPPTQRGFQKAITLQIPASHLYILYQVFRI